MFRMSMLTQKCLLTQEGGTVSTWEGSTKNCVGRSKTSLCEGQI